MKLIRADSPNVKALARNLFSDGHSPRHVASELSISFDEARELQKELAEEIREY